MGYCIQKYYIYEQKRNTMATKKSHPGFKAAAKSIASKGGYSMKSAKAILASASRKASPAAKKKNPRLNKVKGK